MNKVFCALVISVVVPITFIFNSKPVIGADDDLIRIEESVKTKSLSCEYVVIEQKDSLIINEEKEEPEALSEEWQVADADIELIAWITMGEAEGECEEGKRLVIDTILNRVDHKSFPSTIYDVIYQPSQFSCVWNGRLTRTSATEEVCQLVREELDNRCNYDVLYFTAGDYGKYGEHLFNVGNHYFCSE